MGAFWEKKNQKWSNATHVNIVPSVIAGLTDELPELKNFKTLRGSIEKIETLGVELKTVANFEGMSSNFSFYERREKSLNNF
jgi:hypothetical protein